MKEVLHFFYVKFSFLPILGLTVVVFQVTAINFSYCSVQLQVGVTVIIVIAEGTVGLHNVWLKNGRKYKTVNDVVGYVDGIVGMYQNIGNQVFLLLYINKLPGVAKICNYLFNL